jgi:hypothetical protein
MQKSYCKVFRNQELEVGEAQRSERRDQSGFAIPWGGDGR